MTKIQSMAEYALYTAVAFLFGYIESLIPLPLPFPGMKLGLANVVILFILYRKNWKYALSLALLRNVLTSITFGNVFALLYSTAGSLLSLLFMSAFKQGKHFSIVAVSSLGGIMHNIGQLIIASFVVGFSSISWYLPILYFCGMFTGLLIGFVANMCLKRIRSQDLRK